VAIYNCPPEPSAVREMEQGAEGEKKKRGGGGKKTHDSVIQNLFFGLRC